ncbi:hypothetical protein OAR28_04440 [Amylibacter sp.]|nr:hypothetical protein [Amylibacter sp.]
MKNKNYLKVTGLEDILDAFIEKSDPNQKVMYNEEDICYIHKLVRKRKPFTTLEFGVGFSTLTIAHALMLNKLEFDALKDQPKVRNTKMFKHYVVDTNEFWLNNTQSKFPLQLAPFVEFNYSKTHITMLGNLQVCSLYEKIPDVIAEFIYVDAPDPKDVTGSINGLTFQCPERTVMSGDLLLMESTFLPGTFILVDGRTNNVRFLKNHFKRDYEFTWDQKFQRSTFELTEEKLGPYNVLGSELY